jgi:hypothetical protein
MLTDHSPLIAWMKEHEADGAIVEFGALVGEGAVQFVRAFPRRTVYTIDNFDIYSDPTDNLAGLYEGHLRGRGQREVFDEIAGGFPDIVLLEGDSKKVTIPAGEIFFALIDGNHTPEYVRSDFKKVAKRARYVAFHDYRHDLPEVTATIDELLNRGGFDFDVTAQYCIVRTGEYYAAQKRK